MAVCMARVYTNVVRHTFGKVKVNISIPNVWHSMFQRYGTLVSISR